MATPTYPDERFDDKPTDATATGGLAPPDWDAPEGPDPSEPTVVREDQGRAFNSLADLPSWLGGTADED